MTRNEMIRELADYYCLGLETDEETGEYIIDGYDWVSGCSTSYGPWLTLANIVDCLSPLCDDY